MFELVVSTVLPSVNNSDSPRPSPKSSLQLSKVKTKADTMREEFGDEWLQSFNGQHPSNPPSDRVVFKPDG